MSQLKRNDTEVYDFTNENTCEHEKKTPLTTELDDAKFLEMLESPIGPQMGLISPPKTDDPVNKFVPCVSGENTAIELPKPPRRAPKKRSPNFVLGRRFTPEEDAALLAMLEEQGDGFLEALDELMATNTQPNPKPSKKSKLNILKKGK